MRNIAFLSKSDENSVGEMCVGMPNPGDKERLNHDIYQG